MRTKWISLAVCAAALACLVNPAYPQSSAGHGETGLVGVKLYDTGMKLLQMFGNPDQILPIGASGGGAAGGAAGGGGRGKNGSGAGPGAGGGSGVSLDSPFDFGDQMLLQQQSTPMMQAGAGGGGDDETPPPGGGRGRAGGGGGSRAAAAATAQQYLRWVYKRNGCQYGFILDKSNRVVQIEVIGLENKKVHTRRGIGFGDTFKDVMEHYQVPESYQINGDTIVMQYLVRDKVAFRLNRLGVDKPHVVTAIVVAAGKT